MADLLTAIFARAPRWAAVPLRGHEAVSTHGGGKPIDSEAIKLDKFRGETSKGRSYYVNDVCAKVPNNGDD